MMQYLSKLQPFLPGHDRGSLRTGHVSRFGCLYQVGMNGCSKCFSMDKKIEQIAFPLKAALPASEHLDFKSFVHFLSSAQGELFKLLFPHGDPKNSCHWDCHLGTTFSAASLIQDAEHSLHRDTCDEGPTTIYNETSADSQTFLVFEDFTLPNSEGKPVFLPKNNSTFMTFFSQELRHSTHQLSGHRWGFLNFWYKNLHKEDHRRTARKQREAMLLQRENDEIESVHRERLEFVAMSFANHVDYATEEFQAKWASFVSREKDISKMYHGLRRSTRNPDSPRKAKQLDKRLNKSAC